MKTPSPQLVRSLYGEQLDQICQAFREVQRDAMPAGGRAHYLEVADSVCRDAGVELPFTSPTLDRR